MGKKGHYYFRKSGPMWLSFLLIEACHLVDVFSLMLTIRKKRFSFILISWSGKHFIAFWNLHLFKHNILPDELTKTFIQNNAKEKSSKHSHMFCINWSFKLARTFYNNKEKKEKTTTSTGTREDDTQKSTWPWFWMDNPSPRERRISKEHANIARMRSHAAGAIVHSGLSSQGK